jgi:hypothetical protein
MKDAIALIDRIDHAWRCLDGIMLAMEGLEQHVGSERVRGVRHLIEDHYDKLREIRADLAELHGVDRASVDEAKAGEGGQ